jgi:tRNA-specific 2-thiouridylase
MARVVLAMSGGVDSSAAAHLLLEAGHDVTGVFMRHGEESAQACAIDAGPAALPVIQERPGHKQGCCSATDAEDARRVAHRLGIPFYPLDLQAEFRQIVDYFVDEYSAGRTPNPCVMCNNWLKFGRLFDFADSIGAEYVATGHYARLEAAAPDANAGSNGDSNAGSTGDSNAGSNGDSNAGSDANSDASSNADGAPALLRGVDLSKDQSYVLFGIERRLLRRMLLPVGGYEKSEIRALAAHIGLRVADKKDSQEICFVTSGKHDEFVRARRDHDLSGEIVLTDGRVVGTHPGIERFTIGQRRGVGVAMGEPHFVVRIEPDTRRVVIGRHEELARSELTADRANWLVDPPRSPQRGLAKIRYNAAPVPATFAALPGDRIHVRFEEPRHGVAPGQAVVLYDNERVLGGGWIEGP